MSKTSGAITRRDFLKQGAAGAALAGAVSGLPAPAFGEEAARSRVVLVRDASVLNEDGSVNRDVLARMLDDGVRALTKSADAKAAWGKIVRPEDVVGIKTNTWPGLPTPPEMNELILERVRQAGVSGDKVAAEDRGAKANSVFQSSTALINVRPMRSHHWAGVGSCIKNYMPFSDDPQSLHDNSCADLGKLWSLPMVKGKTRLNVLVLLTPLFHSKGPHNFDARYTWPYKGLIVGIDPVAVDATGLAIIEARRAAYFGDEQPLPIPPHHIRYADERYHLGVSNRALIDVEVLGWGEDRLV